MRTIYIERDSWSRYLSSYFDVYKCNLGTTLIHGTTSGWNIHVSIIIWSGLWVSLNSEWKNIGQEFRVKHDMWEKKKGRAVLVRTRMDRLPTSIFKLLRPMVNPSQPIQTNKSRTKSRTAGRIKMKKKCCTRNREGEKYPSVGNHGRNPEGQELHFPPNRWRKLKSTPGGKETREKINGNKKRLGVREMNGAQKISDQICQKCFFFKYVRGKKSSKSISMVAYSCKSSRTFETNTCIKSR